MQKWWIVSCKFPHLANNLSNFIGQLIIQNGFAIVLPHFFITVGYKIVRVPGFCKPLFYAKGEDQKFERKRKLAFGSSN